MDLSYFDINSTKEKSLFIFDRNLRLVGLRFIYVTALGLGATLASFFAHEPADTYIRYVLIGGAALVVNMGIWLLAHVNSQKLELQRAVLVGQLLFDVVLAAFITYDQGGLEARTTALFALPIVSAGLLSSRKMVFATSIIASLAYASVVVLSEINSQSVALDDFLVPLLFYPAFFVILGVIVGYLMKLDRFEIQEKSFDNFLHLIMHQLMHPVSTARSVLDVLDDSGVKPKELKKHIQILKDENQDLLMSLNNLFESLSSEKKVSQDFESDVVTVITAAAEQIAERFDRKADLKIEYDKDQTAMVNAEQNRLQIAMRNIFKTAFLRSEKKQLIRVGLKITKEKVIVTIQDGGVELSTKEIKKIFSKFKIDTDKPEIQGFGLEMFVANKIITSYKGVLRMNSGKQGTLTTVILERSGKK
ncbi:TPA: HAMP domain-containing histidine kinase [Candidatus Saccharibacteria bacterium]|nr:HAMP domain-containing histidine kinase [Candidatus Saccharibacteria bacterium]HIO87489.1 HAMP domain-containing histidine kinase [Candidatus Saccharibacteria bacterium]